RVAFGKAHFAPHHPVQRTLVADDVYLLDIDARSLIDIEDYIDGSGIAIARYPRVNLGKSITACSRRVCQGVDGLVDQLCIVGIARLYRHKRAKGDGIEFLDAGIDHDLAELVFRSLIQRERYVEF